jgi:hypothetical protein
MIYFLNDHKTGFSISKKIAEIIGNVEIRTFIRFWDDCDPENKYIVFIRHPYEIITSGYRYHKICKEDWVIENKNMFWWWIINHFTEESIEKNKNIIEFANFSRNRSYQEILKSLNEEDGIEYEMNNVGYMTVMGLYEYPHYNKKNVMVVKMEDLKNDIFNTTGKMLDFLRININIDSLKKIKDLDLNNMDTKKLEKDPHITNKENLDFVYKKIWTDKLYKKAEIIFPGDLLEKLGYTK